MKKFLATFVSLLALSAFAYEPPTEIPPHIVFVHNGTGRIVLLPPEGQITYLDGNAVEVHSDGSVLINDSAHIHSPRLQEAMTVTLKGRTYTMPKPEGDATSMFYSHGTLWEIDSNGNATDITVESHEKPVSNRNNIRRIQRLIQKNRKGVVTVTSLSAPEPKKADPRDPRGDPNYKPKHRPDLSPPPPSPIYEPEIPILDAAQEKEHIERLRRRFEHRIEQLKSSTNENAKTMIESLKVKLHQIKTGTYKVNYSSPWKKASAKGPIELPPDAVIGVPDPPDKEYYFLKGNTRPPLPPRPTRK